MVKIVLLTVIRVYWLIPEHTRGLWYRGGPASHTAYDAVRAGGGLPAFWTAFEGWTKVN
jgi:hypothetical protein